MLKIETLSLKKEIAMHIRQGHPWIYREALHLPVSGYPAGQVVRIQDSKKHFVAYGIWDPFSPIAVRVCSLLEAKVPDEAWKHQQLREALTQRLSWLSLEQTNAFRLCHGESDVMPGLVIDVYHHTAVVQYDGVGPEAFWSPTLVDVLLESGMTLSLRTIYWKRRRQPGLVLWGETPPQEIDIVENGIKLGVDIRQGQKTGFFLDQRDNRARIRLYAAGKRVWNGFSYTGGFSVSAALGGARHVVSVDTASAALETARRNFQRNGIPLENHEFFPQDVFAHLRTAIANKTLYDMVIVDPPSFAHAEAAVERALAAYQNLYALALQIVAPEGYLAASSCSSHISMDQFLIMLGAASYETQRPLQVLELGGQPPDHPSLPAASETRYLKFVLCRRFAT